MKSARYYIYRNLHAKTFSVQYKGKVIAHPINFIATMCEFRVSENGRQRVLSEKRKNVHARIACENWTEVNDISITEDNALIYYNPYHVSQFQHNSNDVHTMKSVVGVNGHKIYSGTI